MSDSTGKERKGHVAVRLDETTIARIDALVPRLSTDWLHVTRSDVLRSLLLRALEEAEKDLDFLQKPPELGE
ncbi:Hypothetical protein A7982_07959 [Minicystis rosea]|nr:Hypothetical protein A7982_07959 [Minicystis rosea]